MRQLTGDRSVTRGKIVLVPFPFDDLSAAKVRPAACLTVPIGRHRHVVLAFITSRVPADLTDTDIVLDADEADFVLTGLQVSSALGLHRLMTVTSSTIVRELGRIPPERLDDTTTRLRRLFGW